MDKINNCKILSKINMDKTNKVKIINKTNKDKIIKKIKSLNPDAVILMQTLYNPFEISPFSFK